MVPSGLSAFPITPADPAGRVDVVALRRLVARLVAAGVDSIGLLGSTGTYAYLARAERRRALDAALEETGGRVPILVGVGALRTEDAVAFANDAREAGAAAGLLAPVSYTPLTTDEVFEHYVTVARESRLPLCIYDNPGTTHFRFEPSLIGRLARVPGTVALKSPAPDAEAIAGHLAELRDAVPKNFLVGCSGDWHATAALLAGAATWYSVIAGLFPRPALGIVRAAQRGEATEAQRLNEALQPLWELFKRHSSLRVMYASASLLGLCPHAPPRPILPLDAQIREQVAKALEALKLS